MSRLIAPCLAKEFSSDPDFLRPVDLWTTRIAELPTSPTGLHYDGFSLSNSTRNDEEPRKVTSRSSFNICQLLITIAVTR